MTNTIFKDCAPLYRDAGYQPRPINRGTKASKIKGWQRPDAAWTPTELINLESSHADAGIGLLLGSRFPDGTLLGALDIDHDDYVRVASILLGSPICGRIGSKGIAYFVRVKGDGKYRQFRVKPDNGSEPNVVGELLCNKRLCVIPPTIHPITSKPYEWVGKSLLDTPYNELPIIEA